MALLKKVGLAAAVVVLGAGAVASYLVVTFDPNRYKDEVTHWVSQEKQRTLTLAGPVSLGFWPRLHVKLADVSLSEYRQTTEFIHVDGLELAVQVMPLLKGQLQVGQVRAEGVRLRYVRNAQGQRNIDDLLSGNTSSSPDSGSVNFDVAGIAVRGAVVKADDAISGLKGTLDIREFNSGRLAPGQATDVSLDVLANLEGPKAGQFGVKGSLNLTPDIQAERYELRNVDLALAAPQQGLSSQLQAKEMVWQGKEQSASATGLNLKGSGQWRNGKSEVALKQLQLTADQLAFDPKSQTLALAALNLTLDAQQDGEPRSLNLSWPALEVKGQQLKGGPLKAAFEVGGKVALKGSLSTGSPSGNFQQLVLPDAVLNWEGTLPGQGAARSMKGQLRAQVKLEPSPGKGELTQLKLSAQVNEPGLQPVVLQLAGQLSGGALPSGQQVRWQLGGDVNGNPLSSQGQAQLGGARPQVTAQARFRSLDLNSLLPASNQATAASPPPGSVNSTPVDLSGLRAFDGSLSIDADKLAYQQYRLAQAVVRARFNNGVLTLEQLSGQTWGGQIHLQGTAVAGSQSMNLQAKADGVNIQAALHDVMGKEPLEGTGQLTANVQMRGNTVGALLGSMGGKANVVLTDGAVRGINLAQSLRKAKAKLSGKSDDVQRAQQTEKTDFTEMRASFDIDQGVARNQDFLAKSPFLRVTGAGQIDLARSTLDYTVNTTITGTQQGQGGAEMEALKGLTVPVKLTGPFTALDWRMSWSGVAVGAVGNTIKGQIDAKVDKASGRLEDKLRERLLGKPAASASPASGAAAASAPAEQPLSAKDALRNKLKGLLGK